MAKAMKATVALATVGFALFAAPQAQAETRTLKIYHVHLNERSEITYKRDGKYLKDGLNKLNRALRDWRRNEPTKMDPALFDVIWEVYRKTGARGYINVIGGYRSPATNSMLRKRSNGVAEKSQHIRGKAMDFYIPGVSLKALRYAGLKVQAGGVGYYPTSGSPFVHMDVGNVRHWPRMNRRELMAVFPDGKTIHVPSDGKPLAGYDVALASYQARKSRGGGAIIAGGGEVAKRKTLFAALFGGGADEEEDVGGGEEVAVAAATKKPVKKQAAPVDPLPLPEAPAPQAIVATLPRREQAESLDAPRPDADLNKQDAPEVLAFAVPVPNKKPRFAAVQKSVTEPDQAEIAAAIAKANGEAVVQPAVAAVDPEAEQAAIRAALGQQEPEAEKPFFAGVVPVPGRKPKLPEVMLASVAVPVPRPELSGETTAYATNQVPSADMAAMAAAEPLVPADVIGNAAFAEEPSAEVTVASVPSPTARPAKSAASMRTAMIDDVDSDAAVGAVKTTSKAAKPNSKDAKPGLKAKSTVPTPKVGKFALSSAPVAIENQPIAPEYAQALVRAAPTEVYVAGFSQEGPLEAGKFTGKAVNFLRIAKFETQ